MQKGVITLDHPDFKWLTYVHQFQKLRFYNRPSSLQESIQAHPNYFQKPNVVPYHTVLFKSICKNKYYHGSYSLHLAGPSTLFRSFARMSVTTDGSHYKRSTHPDDSDHLQKLSIVREAVKSCSGIGGYPPHPLTEKIR